MFLIDQADRAGEQAANSLLKTLEEPPDHLILIMTAENVYDLLALEKQILFSTDGNGRIYGLSRDRKVTLVLQTNDAEATRLLPAEDSVLAATANMGLVLLLGLGGIGGIRKMRAIRAVA